MTSPRVSFSLSAVLEQTRMTQKALVAESDTATSEQIAVVLTRAGFRVDSTREGYRTLSRFLVGLPSLVVCAERLAGLSGIEVCQQLRALSHRSKLVLLYSQQLSELERQELAVDVGCDAVLSRPFRVGDLEALLRRWEMVPEEPRAWPPAAADMFVVPAPEPLGLPMTQAAEAPPDAEGVAVPLPIPVPIGAPESAPAEPFALEPIERVESVADLVAEAPAPDLDVLNEAAALASAATPAEAPSLVPPSVPRVGDLATMPLPRLLYELYVGTYFGILHLRRERARRAVYFWAGMPVRVDTDQLSESLGHILIETGKIDEEQHKAAQQHAADNGTHLGVALIDLGLLRESELLDSLSLQTERKLVSTLAWRQGIYEVVDDVSFAVGELLGEAHPLNAIWRGVHEHYESGPVLRYFDSIHARYAVATDLYMIQAEQLAARLGQLGVAELLDGKTTFREALTRDATRSIDVARAMYVLLVTDMIQASDTPGEPAPTVDTRARMPPPAALVNYQQIVEASDRIARHYIRAKSVDHFSLLGVARDASATEVESAYEMLLERLQEDEALRGLPPESVRRAREVGSFLSEARRVLTDPAQREAYAGTSDAVGPPEVAAVPSREDRRAHVAAETAYREGLKLIDTDPGAARARLEEAAAARPEEATYRVGVAQAILAGGHRRNEDPRALAYQHLDEALRLDPGHVLASLEAAKLMLAEGLHDDARPHVERVLQRAPHHKLAKKLMREIRLRAAE